jgi:hypothetical protein
MCRYSGGVGACSGGAWRSRRDAGRKKSSKYLACGIDNLRCKVLVFIANHLAKGILYRRIIAVDKVAIDELHRQTRLACAVCQSGTSHMLQTAQAAALVASTHRQLCCRQWPSFFAWAPASCCWLSGEVVWKLSDSPVLKFGCLSRPLRRSCLGCACSLRFPVEASLLGMTPSSRRSHRQRVRRTNGDKLQRWRRLEYKRSSVVRE